MNKKALFLNFFLYKRPLLPYDRVDYGDFGTFSAPFDLGKWAKKMRRSYPPNSTFWSYIDG